ncbi:MAG: AMP-binding protein [Alphaproteobacteria bacterium]|nr:AMP-binding protein [Alphaproteobacteria bacterium]
MGGSNDTLVGPGDNTPPLTSSYVHGVSLTPLSGLTIDQSLADTVARYPDHEALVVRHQAIRWTYAELKERVEVLARGLLALGLEPRDRLGILSPNNAEWILVQFATARIGVILVNINPAYRLPELEYALNKVGCKALVLAPSFKQSDYTAMLRELAPELDGAAPGGLAAERLPDLRWVITLGDRAPKGMLTFDDIVNQGHGVDPARAERIAAQLQFDDPINIQFTSGTTGTPKATTLTHHNIVNNAYFVGEAMALSERDRLCIPVPMYHCFGMVLGALVCTSHGAAMIFPSAGFDAGATLETIEAERCTALHGVPTMFIAELEHPSFKSRDLSSLRTGIIAGAPCPVVLMRRLITEMNLSEITIAYGMTETGPVSFETSVHDTIERKVETVGRVLPHIEVKIVDEQGRIVPPGTPGELLTRGYSVMPNYWGDPEKTASAINAAHWIASGDIAVLDPQGYCQIVGRLKDMLIRGGENIFPREIEELLHTHPKIEDVQVIGVPDPKYGEEVCAWVKLREGESASAEDIRAFCQGKMAHFKIPRYVKFVDAFPMTITGKVQKFVMRRMMAEELTASETPD